MYRKHIKMSQSQATEPNPVVAKSRFLQHLTNVPAVIVAWNLASGAYRTVKSSHNVMHVSLDTSEKAVRFLIQRTIPLIERFEPQVNALDELALRSIEWLENMIAAIASQPEKFLNYIRVKYDEMIESGLHKYDDVKKTAFSTAREVAGRNLEASDDFLNSPSGQMLLMALNSTFDAYEIYLDYILPPLGDERPDLVFGDRARPPLFERADALTETLKERFYKHSLLYLQNTRIRGKLAVAKMSNRNVLNYQLV